MRERGRGGSSESGEKEEDRWRYENDDEARCFREQTNEKGLEDNNLLLVRFGSRVVQDEIITSTEQQFGGSYEIGLSLV